MKEENMAKMLILVPVAALLMAAGYGQPVNPAAEYKVTVVEWCPDSAVTTLPPAKVLAKRKNLAIQNISGTVDCFATFDPSDTPTTSGALGVKFDKANLTIKSFDFGATVPLKMVCSAAMTTPNCLQVIQSR